ELPRNGPLWRRRQESPARLRRPRGILSGFSGPWHQIENLVLVPATEYFQQNSEGLFALLLGRLQNAGEHGLGASSPWGAVAAPVLARADQGADGALTDIVRGIQPRTIEEGKEVGSLVIEMVPEPAVGRIPARVVQHAIELDFQTSRRGQQSVQGDLLVLVALGQGQGLLEHLLHPQREACGASRGARDQFLRAVE